MCGIIGIVGKENVSRKILLALYDLQHRGEQGCGIAVSGDGKIKHHKDEGSVIEVFPNKQKEGILNNLSGKAGIGHTLYSTIGKTGESEQEQVFQPLIGDFHGEQFALAHNGNLIDLEELRKEAREKGYQFKSDISDTEVIMALLSTSHETDFIKALSAILPKLKGAFALVILFKDKVIGIRDGHGIRPLCLGQEDAAFIISSESCVFYTLGANFIREIEPGEIIILGKGGVESRSIWADSPHLDLCIFELIYFARGDSEMAGNDVESYRECAARILAKEKPVDAEIIMPVPESGRIYDSAYAGASHIPMREGIFRNRHAPNRTFLSPRQTDRRSIQRIKLHPLRRVVHGKKICIVEDSIIRASVTPEVASMLRQAGAIEVHVRVCSAPICYPCFLGIDMHTRGELVAANFTIKEIQEKIIQADSLGYLSIGGMIKASGLPRENLCLGCFIGKYPVEPPEGMI